MVEIKLDIHDSSYSHSKYRVSASKQEYKKESQFEKIQYLITHYQFTKLKSRRSSNSFYDVYIRLKKNGKHIFMFKANDGDQIVNKVESYHSKKDTNFPLVIGFKRDDMDQFKYYSFIYLRKKSYDSRLPLDGSFNHKELDKKLEDENNKVNRIKYSSTGSKSHFSSKRDNTNYGQFTKVEYFPDTNDRYESNVLNKQKLFDHERNNKINDSFISLSYLDHVNIYYNKKTNLTVFVEFVDKSGTTHKYLRKDIDGYYWAIYKNSETRLDLFLAELQSIHGQINKNISYMLDNNDGNYNNNITVTSKPDTFREYTMYTHKINSIGSFENTFVIYNGRAINLALDNINHGEKIQSSEIQSSKFSEITTYSDHSNNKEHLLIKLSKDSNTHYYLKRSSRDGSKWRQVSNKELYDARITKDNNPEEQVYGQRINQLLADRNNLRLFFKWIRLEINDSLIILLNKRAGEDYTYEDINSAVINIQPPKEINTLKTYNKKITVSDKTSSDGQCVNPYGYKVFVHDVKDMAKSNSESLVFRFVIPTDASTKRFTEVTLYKKDDKNSLEVDYKKYDKVHNNICVYFYGDDPRPLLLCYKKEAYIPNGERHYFDHWVKVDGLILDMFVCPRATNGAANDQLEKLLGALTKTVGFLNPVNLWRHPGEAGGADGQTPCPALASDPGGTTECKTVTNGTTCTYDVHQYNEQNVKVHVTCDPVIENGKTFYKKLTHRPIGTKGSGAATGINGFRLGDIVYCANGKRSIINYYPKSQEGSGNQGTDFTTTHRWAPLTSVTMYFYNDDTKYEDPLLVVLEFAKVNGLENNNENKEYYKLTSSGNTMEWKKELENPKNVEEAEYPNDTEDSNKAEAAEESSMNEETEKLLMTDETKGSPEHEGSPTAEQAPNGEETPNPDQVPVPGGGPKRKEAPNVEADGSKARGDPNLVTYLNKVRYNVKKDGQIEIHLNCKEKYRLMCNPSNTQSITNGFSPLGVSTDDKIFVEKLTKCEQLLGAGYECFQHKLSSISVKGQNHFAGLKLVIPQNLPEQRATTTSMNHLQEIFLYNIKRNEETVKDKISNGTSFTEIGSYLDQYTPIYYDSNMGDLYVYFYNDAINEGDQGKRGDPRPGLVCLNNQAYRPLNLPKLNGEHYPYTDSDYTKWVRATNINKCVCEDQEEEKIIKLLTEIYFGSFFMKFLQEHLIELSGGAGGLVGLISIITGGTLVFKKITAASTAATAASTKIPI